MDYGDIVIASALLGTLLILLAIGMPIAYSMMISGIGGLFFTTSGVSFSFLLSTFPYSTSAHLTYIVLPLFLLMGDLCFSAGIARRAFASARVWVGAMPGGLAIGSVFACAGFAAVSGSSLATSVTIGRIAIPEMLKEGYSQAIATGTVANAGTLGSLIPPSGLLIIYGIVTETSIADLFLAGLVPGLLSAIAFACIIYLWVIFRPADAPAKSSVRRYSFQEKARSSLGTWEVVVLFLIVTGTIYAGVGTATEAAAFAAAAAVIMVFFRSHSPLHVIKNGLIDAGVHTSAIFALVIGAGLFGIALGTTQLPQAVAEWLGAMDVTAWQMTLILVVPFLLLGTFLDAITMILLIMPIIQPVLAQHQINPIVFGIIVVKCAEIAAVTPPVGLNVFVLKHVAPEVPVMRIFKGATPFILADLIIIGLLVAFNNIALFLVK